MKKEYVIAMGVNRKHSGYKFTKYKSYEVFGWFGGSALVRDDNGKQCFVAVGTNTLRLEDGMFVKIKSGDHADYMEAMKNGGYIKSAMISDGQIYASVTPRNEYAEVLEQLREILRVPKGENILTHAKVVRVLADGLIGLQK